MQPRPGGLKGREKGFNYDLPRMPTPNKTFTLHLGARATRNPMLLRLRSGLL